MLLTNPTFFLLYLMTFVFLKTPSDIKRCQGPRAPAQCGLQKREGKRKVPLSLSAVSLCFLLWTHVCWEGSDGWKDGWVLQRFISFLLFPLSLHSLTLTMQGSTGSAAMLEAILLVFSMWAKTSAHYAVNH